MDFPLASWNQDGGGLEGNAEEGAGNANLGAVGAMAGTRDGDELPNWTRRSVRGPFGTPRRSLIPGQSFEATQTTAATVVGCTGCTQPMQAEP